MKRKTYPFVLWFVRKEKKPWMRKIGRREEKRIV